MDIYLMFFVNLKNFVMRKIYFMFIDLMMNDKMGV